MKNKLNNKMLYCLLLLRASGMQQEEVVKQFSEADQKKIMLYLNDLPELTVDNVRRLKDRVDELIVPELLIDNAEFSMSRNKIDFLIKNRTFSISTTHEAENYLNSLDKIAISSLTAYLDDNSVK